jgi:hypothetical protein
VTNIAGWSEFSGLAPGNYYLDSNAPLGLTFCPKDQGQKDSENSDADPQTGETVDFTLSAGDDITSRDAGLHAANPKGGALISAKIHSW